MSKLIKRKVLGIAVACLLVASLVVAGATAPATLAQDAASVSIDPADSGEVEPDDSFTVDVLVDAGGHDLIAISVEVAYDAAAMATSNPQVTGHNLLGDMQIGPTVTDGTVTYDLVNVTTPQAGVLGSVLTIEFTIDAGATPGDYDITLTTATLLEPPVPGVELDVAVTGGTVTVPGAPPPPGPSVSIDPADSGDVQAGGTFTIDVLVDGADNDLMGIDVEIEYDADAMTTSLGQITAYNLLDAPAWGVIGPTVPDGTVRYTLLNVEAQAGVEGVLMTIEFAVNEDADPGDYDLTITVADLVDETAAKITPVDVNGGTVTVLPAGPVIFDETFLGTLAEGDSAFICTIPEGATVLAIELTTAASPGPDLDLELYDGATLVIGDGGVIDSAPGGSYEGDDFGYSGYSGGEEYITAGGPLGQTYDLMVYAFEGGSYTVTVYYEILGVVDVTPPEIDIEVTASTPTVGEPVTVTVTATDPSGVQMVMFMVSSPWPGGWASSLAAPQVAYEDLIQWVMSFDDEMSVTFVPGWAGTYTVEAWAVDGADNMTPEGNPVTETFEVVA